MIQLECSNCKTQLAIDDAFAGGVCRCQQCGTIQTVPKAGEKASAVGETPRALFKRKARIESALSPYSEALDRAADDMDSSGGLSASSLASAGLRRSSSSPVGDDPGSSGVRPSAAVATAPAKTAKKQSPETSSAGYVPTPSKAAQVVSPAAAPKKKKTALVAGIVGGVLVLGLGGLLVVSTGGEEKTVAAEARLAVTEEGTICGIPLRSSTVVFVLDRSGMTQKAFADLSRVCLKAVESLGSSRKCQVVVWNNHKPLALPSTGPETPNLAAIEEAREALAETYAGSSDLAAHLKSAAADGAQEVVILSAVDADSMLADEVSEALKDAKVRLHVVAVGSDLTGDQMRLIAQSTGGQFRQVPLESLQ